jgi:hypothetical protein
VDLYKIIQTLHEERERLAKLIEHLERVKISKDASMRRKPPRRRGRKAMSAAERRAASERMKKYWAARRAPAGGGAGSGSGTVLDRGDGILKVGVPGMGG